MPITLWGLTVLPRSSFDLNDEQMAAILEEQNVFLVACPGSGKTRALTYKVVYELARLDSERQWIIAITYTHRAANEIRERIERLGVNTRQLWTGTIHSFCLEWILKPYSIYSEELKNGFQMLNSHDSDEILSELCLPYEKFGVSIWDCGYHYESGGYLLRSTDASKHEYLHKIFDSYFEFLKENRQIDFELLLYHSYSLIASHSKIAKFLANIFPYILVDEYQDTKEIQYGILAKILKAGRGKSRTFIVGDPNQAIYQTLGGFAMSAREFGNLSLLTLKKLHLSKNYRSSGRIIDYFSRFGVVDSKIEAAADHKTYQSIITYDCDTRKDQLVDRVVRLIRFSVDDRGISPDEICVVAPWWVHLAGMSRSLVASLPEYSFNGPGLTPFVRDIDNFWYMVSKIILTEPSPRMFIRRLRWARDVITCLEAASVDTVGLDPRKFLRICNSIVIDENDGLSYLRKVFEELFMLLKIDFSILEGLKQHHESFFESSSARLERMRREGTPFADDVESFRRVFRPKEGITISSIHGVKGAEYDVVIAYAILEGMVPHFTDPNGEESATKLLYVIGSRVRRDLHLISESGRRRGRSGPPYVSTTALSACAFDYDDTAICG